MVKHDVLTYLENNRGYLVSGGELSRKLNVSRTAIWKAINILRKDGYDIESVSNEGYKLNANTNILSENIIKSNLKTNILGNRFEIFKTIDSTNTYLKSKAHDIDCQGLVVISDEQTTGRGRIGKKFFSPPQTGIYMSILLHPNMKIVDINMVTIVAAVSVLKAIENKIGVKAEIKWVNDILYNKRKLSGILTEATIEAESGYIQYIIVGIGLNTSKSDLPEDIKDVAISVEEITGQFCNRNDIIAEILNQFEKYYFYTQKEEIINTYGENLAMLGQQIEVIQGSNSYKAKAIGINDNAELIIEDEKGDIKTINSGEISIIAI